MNKESILSTAIALAAISSAIEKKYLGRKKNEEPCKTKAIKKNRIKAKAAKMARKKNRKK